MKIHLKENLSTDKWWGKLSGTVIEVDDKITGMGYKVLPVINDDEFYIPKEAVANIVTKDIKLGIEVLKEGCIPEQHGDWIDVKTAEAVELKAGSIKLIKLGFKTSLPDGMEAWLTLRSSSPQRYNIIQANAVGIIDNQYGGEWKLPVYALKDTNIPEGVRIAQFRLIDNQPFIQIHNTEVTKTRSGFGSTGI